MTRLQIQLYLEQLIDQKIRESGGDPDKIRRESEETPQLSGESFDTFFR